MLISLFSTAAAESKPSGPPHAPFWDTYGTRFQEPVDALYALGVVTGKTSTTFEPGAGVTRAEVAALVIRALGEQPTSASSPFPDVPRNHWAATAITRASELGIIRGGTDGLFRPNDPVTYPQVTAMLIRAVGLEGQAGDYPTGYVLLANRLGLTEGLNWDMNASASRGDVAVMLYRTIFTVKRYGYANTLSQHVFKRAGSIVITPDAEVIPTGTTSLKAKVVDWVGAPLEGSVTWSVTSGDATIDQTGVLTVNGGPVTVTARSGEVVASRTYAVIKSISVKADKTAVPANSQVRLTARGVTSSGEEVTVHPTWAVTRGDGTVTDDGVLTVTGTQPVTVQATVGTMTTTTTVNIVGRVAITPAEAVLGVNKETQFKATVTDPSGKELEVPVTWSVEGGGSIDANGRYRAGSTPATVTAKAGEVSGTARVQVIDRIEISPSNMTLRKGDTQKFTAKAYTPGNQAIDVPVTWSVEPSSLGFFNSDGVLFAANPGSGHVVATYADMKVRTPVAVGGQAAGIQLTATPTTLPANGTSTATITARVVDANGVTASGADYVFFSISSSSLGTLDRTTVPVVNGVATATLTVGTASGTYSVNAYVPGTTIPGASLTFTTTAPSISHIALEAYPNPLAADGVSQTTITAKLVDSTGASIANYTGNVINVTLNTSNVAAGSLISNVIQIPVNQKSASTQFVASASPSSTVITGTSNYLVQSTTVSTQMVGTAYRLKIRMTDKTTAKADSIDELPLYVEVQDVNGNVRTGDNSTVISLNAVKTGVEPLVVASQTTRWGVATFKLKAVRAGTYKVTAWSTNSGLQSDVAEVTFNAGAPYKVGLTVEPSNSLAADGRTTATLKAQILDVNGNLVPTATHAVRFSRLSSSHNVLNMPANLIVNAENGEAKLTITSGSSVGTDHFKADVDGLLSSAIVAVSTRVTGVPVKVQVQPLAVDRIPAGGSATVQVWVLDQLNQLVTSDNGRRVYLAASNGATVNGPATTINGVATFTVTSTNWGGTNLTATADGLQPDVTGRILTVDQGPADHIVLEANPDVMTADGFSRVNISAKLVDRFGNPVSGSFAVNLSLSTNEHISLTGSTVVTGGQTQVVAKNTPGTTVISGTASGYSVRPVTITTYRPGTPTRVVVDPITPIQAGNQFANQVVVRARIVDENGNPATQLSTGSNLTAMALRITGSGGTNSVNISQSNTTGLAAYSIYPNGVTIGAAAVFNGVATFTVTNTRAETITLEPIVFYNGRQMPSVTGTMTTVPGPAARMVVTVPGVASAASPTSVTVTASVADIYGNPVPGTDDTISFMASNNIFVDMPAQNAVQTSTGSASIVLTTRAHATGGNTVITATSRRWGFSGTAILTTDLPPAQPTVIARNAAGTNTLVQPGEAARIMVTTNATRISSQQVLVYVNGAPVQLYTSAELTNTHDTLPPNSTLLTGYIRYLDLGGPGTKEIRAVLKTNMGVSPLSEPAILIVQ